jgi:hypothetical protein
MTPSDAEMIWEAAMRLQNERDGFKRWWQEASEREHRYKTALEEILSLPRHVLDSLYPEMALMDIARKALGVEKLP